jgi:transcriptional regulator with XRE-family HTH domain
VAERFTPEEREEVRAVIHRLYELSGQRSWAALARSAGVSEYSLAEWRKGKGQPSALNLLRLLSATGVLDGGLLERAPQDRPLSLEDAVAKLADEVRKGFVDLRGLVRDLAAGQTSPGEMRRLPSERQARY